MHIPVMTKEVLEALDPRPGENFIDVTYGMGGHTTAILEKGAQVLGIEADEELFEIQNLKFKNNLILVNENFTNLKNVIEKCNLKPIHGILFDLGVSSWHLEKSGRGFSFKRNEPLDMRFSKNTDLTAKKIINSWPEEKIEQILKELGEERFAKRIAQKILEKRKIKPIETTLQLVEIIRQAIPKKAQFTSKIHFATRTFQALRISVNEELENFKKTLPEALEMLAPQGKLSVISFHSLEDRIIKNFFKEREATGEIKILTKKPVRPSRKEIEKNPRARSAKLRICQKEKKKI